MKHAKLDQKGAGLIVTIVVVVALIIAAVFLFNLFFNGNDADDINTNNAVNETQQDLEQGVDEIQEETNQAIDGATSQD